MSLTLVQLRHLLALADLKSFNKAAENQSLTQPALSRSIRALEQTLGKPLFDRLGRQAEPTPFGREVIERARHVIADTDDLLSSAGQMVMGQAGSLSLGMGSGPGAMLMTPMLKHMVQNHPRMRFEITRGNTELLIVALREQRLDAAIIDARSLKPSADIRVSLLSEMRGTFMCRPGHPLAEKRRVGLNDIRQFPVVSTPLSDELAREMIKRYGSEAHPDALITLRCDDISSLVEVVKDSDAVLLSIRAAAPDLIELPIHPAMDAPARYALATLAKRSQSLALPLVRKFVKSLLVDAAPRT